MSLHLINNRIRSYLFYFSVYTFMFACVHLYVHVCAEARSQSPGCFSQLFSTFFFSFFLFFFFLRQYLSLDLKLTSLARLAGQCTLRSSCPWLPRAVTTAVHCHTWFLCVVAGHEAQAVTKFTEPSPSPGLTFS